MPPSLKTLSPAELAKLEHAFATDPASAAYKPLAEAYLGMGRFMEAMVVCKKGVKAHPQLPDARLLLARVYAEQGKDKKALEELEGALTIAPKDKQVLRLLGAVLVRSGDADAGKARLLEAYEADPKDAETLDAMKMAQVAVPKPPEPPPPPIPPRQPPPTEGGALPSGLNLPQPAPSPHSLRPSRPALTPPGVRAARSLEASGYDDSGEFQAQPARKKSGASRAIFFLLLFAVPVAAAAYWGVGQYRARLSRDANKALRDATEKIKSDTYAGYQQGIELAEQALGLDAASDSNRYSRGLLAYAYAVRWGEHQRDESNREAAARYLSQGLSNNDSSAYLHAADALFKFYSGHDREALASIEERIRAAEAEKKQVALYYLTRGIIQMNSGDLEAARESLDRGQAIAPDDPRIYIGLGNVHRRRGSDMQALTAFNNALRYTRNLHPDGLLGTAMLVLDQADPAKGYLTAAKYVKTVLELEPPPSPRQLAQAHFVKALLISRVANDLPLYTDKEFQKQLEEGTGVSGESDKARSEVAKEENEGLAFDRNNPELLMIRGRRLAYEGKHDEAATALRNAIEMNPSASLLHVELAKVLMRKEGGEAQAEEALKKALSLVPNSPKLLAMLGEAQFRQRKFEAAVTTLEKAVADSKVRNPEARFLLGKLLRDEKRDYARATELLEKAALEYFSDPAQAAQTYDELALTYELRSDKEKARTSYEKALNADKDFAATYCHYARFLSKWNDAKEQEKARSLAGEFLKLSPRDECASEMQRLRPEG